MKFFDFQWFFWGENLLLTLTKSERLSTINHPSYHSTIYMITQFILINFLTDAETPEYTLIPERNLLVIDICFQMIII